MIHAHFYYNRRYTAATSLPLLLYSQAGRLVIRDFHILFQVCVGLSGLCAPISRGVWTVSSRRPSGLYIGDDNGPLTDLSAMRAAWGKMRHSTPTFALLNNANPTRLTTTLLCAVLRGSR